MMILHCALSPKPQRQVEVESACVVRTVNYAALQLEHIVSQTGRHRNVGGMKITGTVQTQQLVLKRYTRACINQYINQHQYLNIHHHYTDK